MKLTSIESADFLSFQDGEIPSVELLQEKLNAKAAEIAKILGCTNNEAFEFIQRTFERKINSLISGITSCTSKQNEQAQKLNDNHSRVTHIQPRLGYTEGGFKIDAGRPGFFKQLGILFAGNGGTDI